MCQITTVVWTFIDWRNNSEAAIHSLQRLRTPSKEPKQVRNIISDHRLGSPKALKRSGRESPGVFIAPGVQQNAFEDRLNTKRGESRCRACCKTFVMESDPF